MTWLEILKILVNILDTIKSFHFHNALEKLKKNEGSRFLKKGRRCGIPIKRHTTLLFAILNEAGICF